MRKLRTLWPVTLMAAFAFTFGCSDDSPGHNNTGDGGVDGRVDAAVPNCEMDPPDPELLLPAGPHPEEGTILIGGRLITPAGDLVPLDGFPINVKLLPSGDHLLVTEAGGPGFGSGKGSRRKMWRGRRGR